MAQADDWNEASTAVDGLTLRTRDLTTSANSFARTMTQAFTSSVSGGKQFDDVLKSLASRVSDIAVKLAFKPIETALSGALQGLFTGGGAGATATAVKPFASGGVIGTPSYFPMPGGGIGLAGEAGPEAIMPLQARRRWPARRCRGSGGGDTTINVSIATPDVDSFRRSESYITGQMMRAVARGHRSN